MLYIEGASAAWKRLFTVAQFLSALSSMKRFYCLLAWRVARPEIFLLVHFVIGLPTAQVCYFTGRLTKNLFLNKISAIIPLLITLSAA